MKVEDECSRNEGGVAMKIVNNGGVEEGKGHGIYSILILE